MLYVLPTESCVFVHCHAESCLLLADKYLKDIPKSPVRELLEMEPETAKFE